MGIGRWGWGWGAAAAGCGFAGGWLGSDPGVLSEAVEGGNVAGTWVEVPSGLCTSTRLEKLTAGVCVPESAWVVLLGWVWSNGLAPEPGKVLRGGRPWSGGVEGLLIVRGIHLINWDRRRVIRDERGSCLVSETFDVQCNVAAEESWDVRVPGVSIYTGI